MAALDGIGLPGDAAYESAIRVFNLAAPLAPAAAITVGDVEQIRAALRYARQRGLGVRVISTGHASASERPMADSLLVRTEMAGAVEVDVARRVARVPAGTPWRAVVDATTPHGLLPPHGSAGTVGAVGYLLRGGISFYGRKVGLASNSVRAVELVTADGSLLRADGETNADVLWALRGGGGGFGVVTSVEVALFPATDVVTGAAFWPGEVAGSVLSTWLAWIRDAPDVVTTTLRVLNLPPVPEVPPALRGRTVVCVDGVVLASDSLADALGVADTLLTPLRRIAEPIMDSWHGTTPGAVLATHMDPEEPVPAQGDHMLLRDLGVDGAAEFLRLVGGSDSPLVLAGLRQLGGALAVPAVDGGALSCLDADLLYSAAGIPFDAAASAAIAGRLGEIRAALGPWDTGFTAPTFVESVGQPQRHLDAVRVGRADAVRARLDPGGLFSGDIAVNASAVRAA